MKPFSLLMAVLLGASFVFADEKAPLEDFVLPVPANFTTLAAAATKASGKDLTFYLKAQGIRFPEGGRVEMDAAKRILAVRLPHQETLHLIQLINAFMGESAGEFSKNVFGSGGTSDAPESRCFGPVPD